ncbi:serine/threonine-protein kinase, partial [Nocardiopsis metallicus]|uniref:serine/threonine-protein kinase n=1 Tax=Nocardiopsis metallicus TaxID=179819 RepID=UPI0031CF47C9
MVPTGPPDPSGPTQDLSGRGPRRSVGRYELLSELGSGAMGTVWRAHDTGLNRMVAIKEVHLPYDMPPRERERARARVVREAQAAARIAHPSVVTVHDVLEADGVPYIVMELLDGESLSERLKRSGPMRETEVERIARPLLGALWAAHRAGVIHRDVKPANIMLTEDGARPVLTDFGIANLPDHGGTALTGTGTILGTAAYAAPERLENDETSAVSDLWSLGATLFAALNGESPFKRDTLTSTLTAVLTQPVPPVPAGGRLASVVGRLLERDPRRRLLPEQALTVLDDPEAG